MTRPRILAQGMDEVRLLLSGYFGSQNAEDSAIRRAAPIADVFHSKA